uniref:RNA-directed RNA polymerase n=1 Tax=Rhizoctonia solani dsRNA virus 6 TaxID=2600102 RepID=A0A5B8HDI3_9VIRU|nr:RNA-dependent RNA polymerase [Rhizoctonia solani dsRNA virus 6]
MYRAAEWDFPEAAGASFPHRTHRYDEDIIFSALDVPSEGWAYIIGHPLAGKTKITALLRKLGYVVYDGDDLYQFEDIRTLVFAEDWPAANAIKSKQIANSCRTLTPGVIFCHGHDDVRHLNASYLGCIIHDDSNIRGHAERHPDRYHFAKLTKRGINTDRKRFEPIYNVSNYEASTRIITALVQLHQPNLRGAQVLTYPRNPDKTDSNTKLYPAALRRAASENKAMIGVSKAQPPCEDIITNLLADISDTEAVHALLKILYPDPYPQVKANARGGHRLCATWLSCWANNDEALQRLNVFLPPLLYHSGGLDIICLQSLLMMGMSSEGCANVLRRFAVAGHLGNGVKHMVNTFKGLHEHVRRAAAIPKVFADCGLVHFTQLMYWQCLGGRFYHKLLADDGAVDARTKDLSLHQSAREDGFYSYAAHTELLAESFDRFRPSIRDGLSQCTDLSLDKFRAALLSVASSGSGASGKHELKHLDLEARANKRLWLDELTDELITNIPDQRGEVLSSAVCKLELGKLRQLLPGPVWHWLAESIVQFKVERKVFEGDDYIMLEKGENTRYKRYMERVFRHTTNDRGTVLDMDYADFNITHMVADMVQMYRTIREEAIALCPYSSDRSWGGRTYMEYVVELCDYLEECLMNLYMRADGGDGRYKHLIKGLWSGWRTTQFLNTSLNSAYMNQARASLRLQLGFDMFIQAEGSGDDVDLLVRDRVSALCAIVHWVRSGHEMNELKQLLGRYSSEFLRVTYDEQGSHGNIARSVGSFLSSDLQSAAVEYGPTGVTGTASAFEVLFRRGYDHSMLNLIRPSTLEHFSAIRYYDNSSGDLKYDKLSYDLMCISGHNGGLGISDYGKLPAEYHHHVRADWKNIAPTKRELKFEAHSLASIKRVAAKTLHSLRLDPAVAELVLNAAEQAVHEPYSAGDDILQSSVDKTAAAREYYSHLKQFRVHKPKPNVYLSPEIRDVICNTMDYYLGNNPHAWDTLHVADAEDIASTIIGLALGDMNISTDILTRLRTRDGITLSARQALNTLAKPGTFKLMAALSNLYHEQLADLYLYGRNRSVMNVGGILPADLNCVLKAVHNQVFGHIAGNHPLPEDYDIREMLLAINREFIRHYTADYAQQHHA